MDAGDKPLTELELADSSGVPVDFIRQLVAEKLVTPAADGRFPRRYARRVRLFRGIHASGVGLDSIRMLFEGRLADVDSGDMFMPQPSPRSQRTFADFRAGLGERAQVFDQIWSIFGFPEPGSDDHLGLEDEEAMASLLGAWGDP